VSKTPSQSGFSLKVKLSLTIELMIITDEKSWFGKVVLNAMSDDKPLYVYHKLKRCRDSSELGTPEVMTNSVWI